MKINIDKKNLRIAEAAVAVLAVIIAVVIIISNHTGYKSFVSKVMTAYLKFDVETLVNNTSPTMNDYYSEVYGSDHAAEYYREVMSADHDHFKENVGENYLLDYSITDVNELSDERTEAFENKLEGSSDADFSSVKKILVVRIKISAEDDDGENDIVRNLYLAKDGGKWTVFGFDLEDQK